LDFLSTCYGTEEEETVDKVVDDNNEVDDIKVGKNNNKVQVAGVQQYGARRN
jgi:hypothetical protein